MGHIQMNKIFSHLNIVTNYILIMRYKWIKEGHQYSNNFGDSQSAVIISLTALSVATTNSLSGGVTIGQCRKRFPMSNISIKAIYVYLIWIFHMHYVKNEFGDNNLTLFIQILDTSQFA